MTDYELIATIPRKLLLNALAGEIKDQAKLLKNLEFHDKYALNLQILVRAWLNAKRAEDTEHLLIVQDLIDDEVRK